MLKLSQENRIIDLPDLNRFQIGDEVVVDASADNDRFEGVIIGIELRRLHGSNYLVPSITLLHDGYITDEFKPVDCRKVSPPAPQPNAMGVQAAAIVEEYDAFLAARQDYAPTARLVASDAIGGKALDLLRTIIREDRL